MRRVDRRSTDRDISPPLEIVGSSPALRAAVRLAREAAPRDIPVLIVGETGTGKELIARLIHWTGRRQGPMVAVDCGALPDELLESLLFGHRRGAFTGAVDHTKGLIAEADEGTLFLDELSSLSTRGQSKLLRVLETGSVRRVGEFRSRPIGFRLVATAQERLGEMMRTGLFRDDLVQRVAGIVIRLPTLRDRGDDVIVLARHFARGEGLSLTDAAAAILARREWPGNVRELKWMMARCAFFARDHVIDADTVRAAMEIGPAQLSVGEPIMGEAMDLLELRAACESHDGDPGAVARALGIGRSTLYRRLKRAGIRLAAFRPASITA